MKLTDKYLEYILMGNDEAVYRMECLYGYPPEIVSVAFNAMDKGEDVDAAIERYISRS
jgi:hypothetical protein